MKSILGFIKNKRFQRRKRLVAKWKMTQEFKNITISEKFNIEIMSLMPTSNDWHFMTATINAWVQKTDDRDIRMAEISVYNGAELVHKFILQPADAIDLREQSHQ